MKTAIHALYGHLTLPGADGLITRFDCNFVVANYSDKTIDTDEDRIEAIKEMDGVARGLMTRWNIEALVYCFKGEESASIISRSGVDMSKLSPHHKPGECVPDKVHLSSFCKDLIGTFEIPGIGMIEALKRIYPEAFTGEVYGFGSTPEDKACFESAGCKFEWGSIARSPFVGINN